MFDLDEIRCEAPDMEMLGDSLLERLEGIIRMLDGLSAGFPDAKEEAPGEDEDESGEDGDDEPEYSETYGASKEELRKYVEKFRDYAKEIKRNAEEIYGAASGNESKKRDEKANDSGMKSPFERGHKMGCGCPGCSAYREFYGIKIERKTHFPGHAFSAAGAARINESGKRNEKYGEKSDRPCGGKLYNHFHGERAGLQRVLGSYTGGFNFGRAGY